MRSWHGRRSVLELLLAVLIGGNSQSVASPALDVMNDVGPLSAALSLRTNNHWSQTFAATAVGLLSRIDLQIGKFAGAVGDVQVQLRRVVDGAPTASESGVLFIGTLGIDAVPVLESFEAPPPFVSVDVTSAGIRAEPGEQFAISLSRNAGSPAAVWRSRPESYSGGEAYFRSSLSAPWSPDVEEMGFRTWIDPTPSDPYKLVVEPTFDARFVVDSPTLIEGEGTLLVGGSPESRAILEFPLGALPAKAAVRAAALELDWSGSSGAPRLELLGYAGDGLGLPGDMTVDAGLLTLAPQTSVASPNLLSIDEDVVAAIARGGASHLGVRIKGLDTPQYVSFYAAEGVATSLLPPRLILEYTLPLNDGDLNADGIVDGSDFLVWQRGYPGDFDAIDLASWKMGMLHASNANLGCLPEPTGVTGIFLMGCVLLPNLPHRRRASSILLVNGWPASLAS